MPDQVIICPQCTFSFPLNETLTDQIKHELQHQLEKEQQKHAAELQQQMKKLVVQQAELEKAKLNLNQDVKAQLEVEKQKLWQLAQAKAQEKVTTELKDLQDQFQEKAKQLEAAQKFELELRKQARDLEEQKRTFDLDMQRKMDEERKKIQEETRRTESDQFRLKLLEKDKQVEIMQKTIEDLRRQSQQGSMQIQGEVQENDLKQLLSTTFYTDTIQDVPTGIKGADLIQTVNNQFGQKAGVMLWESKNTKQWSNDWVTKLKQDQGIAQADVCLLVSKVLPDEIKGFGIKNGVWVLDSQYVVPLVTTLRYHLLELAKVKSSVVGRDQKMEYLYQYLSGTQFKNRIESIVTAFDQMQQDLAIERRAMEKMWRKRSQEIERVITNTAGLYGDIQGIGLTSLPVIPALELPGSLNEELEDRPENQNPGAQESLL
ncbi:MAG: DUF2130 domain-containing protein [bacterium]|nr:DUF2130 domain-containing protein [bacterium]